MVTPNALKTHAGMCFHAAAVRQVLEKMPTGVGMIYIFKAAEKKKDFKLVSEEPLQTIALTLQPFMRVLKRGQTAWKWTTFQASKKVVHVAAV